MRFLNSLQPVALLAMRVAAGALLAAHGWMKVLDYGRSHVRLVESLHLPGWLAYVSMAAELLGGLMLVAGLLTRLAALATTINMGVATFLVHWPHGLEGGIGFPMALLALSFALLCFGAGPLSLDRWLLHNRWG